MLANMFKKPEILDKEKHKDLKLSNYKDLSFAKGVYLAPIGIEEMILASKTLVIVFVKEQSGEIYPAVVLGADDGENLYLDENSKWRDNYYIPATIRAYPFGLSADENGKYIAIDSSASCLNQVEGKPLFDEELNNTKEAQNSFSFVNDVYTQIEMIKDLGKELEGYGILKQANIEITKGEQKSSLSKGIYVVDETALNKLESRKIKKLATKGVLQFVYAHLFSLKNNI